MRLPRINTFKSDPTGWIGSGVMLAFAAIAAWRWSQSELLYFALTALRDVAAAYFLLARRPALTQLGSSRAVEMLAYVSSALPLTYNVGHNNLTNLGAAAANCVGIVGYALATFALLDLGESFGVAPANRGIVRLGVYRWLRHPMYLGYSLAEAGFILLNQSNAFLWLLSTALYSLRGRRESQILRS